MFCMFLQVCHKTPSSGEKLATRPQGFKRLPKKVKKQNTSGCDTGRDFSAFVQNVWLLAVLLRLTEYPNPLRRLF